MRSFREISCCPSWGSTVKRPSTPRSIHRSRSVAAVAAVQAVAGPAERAAWAERTAAAERAVQALLPAAPPQPQAVLAGPACPVRAGLPVANSAAREEPAV